MTNSYYTFESSPSLKLIIQVFTMGNVYTEFMGTFLIEKLIFSIDTVNRSPRIKNDRESHRLKLKIKLIIPNYS